MRVCSSILIAASAFSPRADTGPGPWRDRNRGASRLLRPRETQTRQARRISAGVMLADQKIDISHRPLSAGRRGRAHEALPL